MQRMSLSENGANTEEIKPKDEKKEIRY